MSKQNKDNKSGVVDNESILQQQLKSLNFQLHLRVQENDENKQHIKTYLTTIENLNKEIQDLKKVINQSFLNENTIVSLNERSIKLEREIKSLHEKIDINSKKYNEEKDNLIKTYEEKLSKMKILVDNNNAKLDLVNSLEKFKETHVNSIRELECKNEDALKDYKDKLEQRKLKQGIKFSDLKRKIMENIEYTQKNVEQMNIEHIDVTTKLTLLHNSQLLVEIECLNKEIEKSIAQKDMYEKKIFNITRDFEIHKSVEIDLAEKNKKYATIINSLNNQIKNLNEKIFNLERNALEAEELYNDDGNLNEENINEPTPYNRNSGSFRDSFCKPRSNNRIELVKENNIFLSKSREVNNDVKKFQIVINFEKKIQNLLRLLKMKEKDYYIIKLNYENLKETVDAFEKKVNGLYKLFEHGINLLTEDSTFRFINKENKLDLEKIKNCEFDHLSNEDKYFILMTLMKNIAPYLNLKMFNQNVNSNDNIIGKNLTSKYRFNKNYQEIDMMDKSLKKSKMIRSSSGLDIPIYPKIDLPKIELKDTRFILPNKFTILNPQNLI